MNKETLSQYRALKAEIEAIREQIEEIRATHCISAISYDDMPKAPGRNTAGPVERTVIKLDELERRYHEKLKTACEELESIEEWIDTLKDTEVKALCRYRYILGYSWAATALRVYNRCAEDAARKRVERYFQAGGNSSYKK